MWTVRQEGDRVSTYEPQPCWVLRVHVGSRLHMADMYDIHCNHEGCN